MKCFTKSISVLAMLTVGLTGLLSAGSRQPVTSGQDNVRLAAVETGNKWGYIDQTGKFEIQPRFEGADRFSEGLASVEIADKWGFIDATGKLVVNPRFDVAYNFSEGLAAVRDGGKCGYIDKTGQFVIVVQFVQCGDFSGGLAEVTIETAKSDTRANGHSAYGGFIDRGGRIVTQQRFGNLWGFHEELAAVQDGLWGFINRTGKYVITPQFENIGHGFFDGLALVSEGGKWGYIQKSGKYMIIPQFDGAH